MSKARQHDFHTPGSLRLLVENGRGTVDIEATETEESTVRISGRDADEVDVTYDDGQLSVVALQRRTGFHAGDSALHMTIGVPFGVHLRIKTGSADVTARGTFGPTQVKSGSGDVRLDTLGAASQIETGSGSVSIDSAHAELEIKSGSGQVAASHTKSSVAVSTGSGDIELGTTAGPAVAKTGSGDFRVVEALSDVSLSTGSGDLLVETARQGRIQVKGASGDVRIGIPAGIPVWTDISTVSGDIRSDLDGAGEPIEGGDYIEVRAKTASGDITLHQI